VVRALADGLTNTEVRARTGASMERIANLRRELAARNVSGVRR
jgi:hypothetical protein